MKKILITLRVDVNQTYDERRDAIDQRWIKFLTEMDLQPVLLSNDMKHTKYYLKERSIDGVLLTGGNSLARYGGDAPERDEIEKHLINFSITNKIPLLGVCRGMQVIQDFFGIPLQPIEGHVKCRHQFEIVNQSIISDTLASSKDVNAYHTYGAFEESEHLKTILRAKDGVILSVEHSRLPLYGIMWHPERETPFNPSDQRLIRGIFNTNSNNG